MPSPVNELAGVNRMSAATIFASLVLAVLLAVASTLMLLDPVSVTKNAEHLGAARGLYLYVVGACRGLAIMGLIVGLYWWPMEIVAASGDVLLMIAAVGSHRHSGNPGILAS
jgi:hypothetical protein